MPQPGLAKRRLEQGRSDVTPRRVSSRAGAGSAPRRVSGRNGGGGSAFDGEDVIAGVPGRRTITITGYGVVDRIQPPTTRRRPVEPVHRRPGFRPDRTA